MSFKTFLVETNLSAIERFLKSKARNEWLEVDTFSIYVRKGYHLIQGKIVHCFDVASIEADEGERGKGKFKLFMTELKSLLENHTDLRGNITMIFVENVLNSKLVESLPRMGFMSVTQSDPPSFYQELTIDR